MLCDLIIILSFMRAGERAASIGYLLACDLRSEQWAHHLTFLLLGGFTLVSLLLLLVFFFFLSIIPERSFFSTLSSSYIPPSFSSSFVGD